MKLKLAGTRLLEQDAAMEVLGKLPKLEILLLPWSSFQGQELAFKSPQAGISFGSLRVLVFFVESRFKSVKFEEGTMPKVEVLFLRGDVVDNEFCFSGLEFLPSINEVQLHVYFPWDEERIKAAPDFKTRAKLREEVKQEQAPKRGELKKKIQDQLFRCANEPIVVVE